MDLVASRSKDQRWFLRLAMVVWLLAMLPAGAALTHRWSFNETSGTNLFDSVGTAHAFVVTIAGGGDYQLDGKRIRLDGGARSNADYVLFPTNVFAGLSNVTIEMWAVPHSFQNFGRIFEIGSGVDNDGMTRLINGALDNNGGDPLNKLIVPGDTNHSVSLQRLRGNGFSRMPPLATHELDQGAISLVARWISTELTNRLSFADWQIAWFGSTNNPLAAANSGPDGDGANNYYEYLTQTSPLTNVPPPWSFAIDEALGTVGVGFVRVANLGFIVETSTTFSNWTVWDVPANRLWYSASNFVDTITGPLTGEKSRFYRVKIYEP